MAPVTAFAVHDPYDYLEGLGNYLQSEAVQGAIPPVNNSPQKPPLGLRTERISGSSFVAPRDHSYQTWLYRACSSLEHSDFSPLELTAGYGPASPTNLNHVTPNSYHWDFMPTPSSADWVSGQQLLGRSGEPQKKEGLAMWVFSVTQDMPERQVFSSLDGEMLVIPQSGALDIQTELGRLLVRQSEMAVIPRGVRYRVTLPNQSPCRGYICELSQGHFRLPDLGVVGSTGLANIRDFQVPVAYVDDKENFLSQEKQKKEEEWTIVSRLVGKPWYCTQNHTPFDVAGWHGTCYPYKYDLGRFCALGNVRFDEHDPSLYTVLTARNHGAEPSTAVVDFAVVPPRWSVAQDTLWVPYFHRNTMQEFYAPIISLQDPRHPLNGATNQFRPFAAGVMNCMSTHGPAERDLLSEQERDTTRPAKLNDEGVMILLLEMDRPLILSDWAHGCVELNMQKHAGKL
ncbi:Homogentisate 1,2-dioxygenase [Cryphonectria parasitica EP155]|uniref:homogentisate 1,2-dioxygenase n=1 Tax=Cryphonectria parasitica (strain ATCC 38755 / EP155) TaxID=660469 RepID=A0A9P5CJR0_CRYP1|nr:Homogentisate 1,2-dioxygenase [Cryphonectria parasitica EP155]KAF3759980.1 Homogentisate 1,2-dioxygenase [Cryphonectria parasitica EP155]